MRSLRECLRDMLKSRDAEKRNIERKKKSEKFWKVIGCVDMLLSIALTGFTFYTMVRPIVAQGAALVESETGFTQRDDAEGSKDNRAAEREAERAVPRDDFEPIGTEDSFDQDETAALAAYFGALDDMERDTYSTYESAELALTKIIDWKYCPRKLKAAALYNRGLCRCALKNRPSALSDFESSRELVESPQANFAIGNMYTNIYGEYEKALSYYERAIELSPLPEYKDARDVANAALIQESK